MVCQKCGKDNLDNSIYCSSCGEKFDSEKNAKMRIKILKKIKKLVKKK